MATASVKKEVKAEEIEVEADFGDYEEVDLPGEADGEVVPGGEGGILVHGTLLLTTDDRAVLFSPHLDSKVEGIVCRICRAVTRNMAAWRTHCGTKHNNVPGFTPFLLHSSEMLTPADFSPVPGRMVPCPRCERTFATVQDMKDHKLNSMRTVRLVCPQCSGQYSDLELHIEAEHKGCVECGTCGLETYELLAHYHSLHDGFSSVLAESLGNCFGDGITTEWFETVLETSLRFLASEVKPESAVSETVLAQLQASQTDSEDTSGGDGRLLVKLLPLAALKQPDNINNSINNMSHVLKQNLMPRTSAPGEMTEEERDRYNAAEYAKFRRKGTPPSSSRNECEICGFVPYTKNKYREKQDHLAKSHFKERIDALIPTQRPYTCPEPVCVYVGKDKQDILRHYTGKHNMLRMWVDEFILKQRALQGAKENPVLSPADSPPLVKATATAAFTVKAAPTTNKAPTSMEATPTKDIITTKCTGMSEAYSTVLVTVSAKPTPPSITTPPSQPGKDDSEVLTFAEMERRAILRQKQQQEAAEAGIAVPTTGCASRAIVLPQRINTGGSQQQQQLVVSLMPIVPAMAANSASSEPAETRTVAITPLALAGSGSPIAGGGKFLSIAPKAVTSLVDASGRPALTGGLQTVTVSTPSGQISLTKVNPSGGLLDRKRSIEADQPNSVAAQLLLNSLNLQQTGPTTTSSGNLILVRCNQCPGNKVFPSFAALDAHVKKAHGEQTRLSLSEPGRSYSCDICTTSIHFTSPAELEKHKDLVHKDEAVDPLATTKPFACPECAMKFPTHTALKLHLSICREQPSGLTATLLVPVSSAATEPPKKKPKRAPPPLLKI